MLSLDDFRNLARALCAFLRAPGFPKVFQINVFVENVPQEIIDEVEDEFFQHDGEGEIHKAFFLVRLSGRQCQMCFRLRGRGQASERNRMIGRITPWQDVN